MIALGIRYLTKYAVATDVSRQEPEWPPHPGRVFMAMAAAHFETGAEPAERVALEWMESAPAPALRASGAYARTTVGTYVPVNDDHGGLERRPRQERAFHCIRPHEDCVYLIWESEPTAEIREALRRICAKVTRVGHSVSAVQMWVTLPGEEPAANWAPEEGLHGARLRVAAPGTLRSLESAFNGASIQEFDGLKEALTAARGREKQRLKAALQERFPHGRPESRRPRLTHWQAYGRPAQSVLEPSAWEGPFEEEVIVLAKLSGPVLGLESALQLTGALRNCAMKAAGDRVPEWLSGHDKTGAPSKHPHVAFFPLPFVGCKFADGRIAGLGMAIPREFQPDVCDNRDEELRRILGPLFFDTRTGEERQIKIWKSGVWDWTLERETRAQPPYSLQRERWTRPSRRWASVTPMVLHHYPKKRHGDVERIVREGFISAQFPAPASVQIQSVSAVQGAGHAMSMPPFTEGGAQLCRYQTHVVVEFAQPVRGPLLAGRGRFRGYGLFRPLAEGEAKG